MYKVNNLGIDRDSYVRKEGLKGLIFGSFYGVIMISLTYISMSKWVTFFYAVSPLLLAMIILLFLIAPLKMLKRHNRTIKGIRFEEEFIIIEVFAALWMKSKEHIFNRNTLKVCDSKFHWYGKHRKEGIILKNKNEYYLVLEYFSESEVIKKQLM